MSLRTDRLHPLAIDPQREIHGVLLDLIPQTKGTPWCWAACVQMILKHYDLEKDAQCVIARKGISLVYPVPQTCCDAGGSEACNKRLSDEAISRLWCEVYRIPVTYKRVAKPGTLVERFVWLLNEAFPIEMGYFNGAGHVMILYGHDQETGSNEFSFYFRDPGTKEDVACPSDEVFRLDGVLNATWEIFRERRRRQDSVGK